MVGVCGERPRIEDIKGRESQDNAELTGLIWQLHFRKDTALRTGSPACLTAQSVLGNGSRRLASAADIESKSTSRKAVVLLKTLR